MVVGGYNYDLGGRLSDVELVSLDPDNNPVPPCLANLNDFPVERGCATRCGDGHFLDTFW